MSGDTLTCDINGDEGNVRYVYSIVEDYFLIGGKKVRSYGVKAESFVYKDGEVILEYSDEIKNVTPYKEKIKRCIDFMHRNTISPLHILELFECEEEECCKEFDEASGIA